MESDYDCVPKHIVRGLWMGPDLYVGSGLAFLLSLYRGRRTGLCLRGGLQTNSTFSSFSYLFLNLLLFNARCTCLATYFIFFPFIMVFSIFLMSYKKDVLYFDYFIRENS